MRRAWTENRTIAHCQWPSKCICTMLIATGRGILRWSCSCTQQKQQHEFDRNLVSLFWRSLSFTMGNWASSQQNSINTSVYLGKHRKMAIVFLYDMKCGNLSSTDSRAFLIMQFLHYLRCIVAKTRCQMLVSSPKSVWHHKKLKLWWQYYYLFFCSSCKRLRTSKY